MQDIGKKVSHIITNITLDDMQPIVEVTLIFYVSRVHIVYQNILIRWDAPRWTLSDTI